MNLGFFHKKKKCNKIMGIDWPKTSLIPNPKKEDLSNLIEPAVGYKHIGHLDSVRSLIIFQNSGQDPW